MGRPSLKRCRNNNQSVASNRTSMAPPSFSLRSSSSSSSSSRFHNLRRKPISLILLISFVILIIYFTTFTTFVVSSSHTYSFDLVNEFPHDPNAFTQGLLYGGNNTLFESTGLYKQSSVRQVHLQTGKVLAFHKMDDSLFGEGLTLLGERLFQVTWLDKTGFIYDRRNLSKWTMFTHEMHDGWGLATDGKVLFGSDGSSSIYVLDPKSLKVIREVTVTYKGHKIFYLNELEYINGEVWANVWQTDCIARISLRDGKVLGWIILQKLRQGLLASGHQNIDVLNGIAWDKEKNRLFVTGKLWPKLYEIKVHPVKAPSEGVEKICLPKSVPGVPFS